MTSRWILLISIPIAAVATVFAWSIAPIYGIVVAVLSIVLIISMMMLLNFMRNRHTNENIKGVITGSNVDMNVRVAPDIILSPPPEPEPISEETVEEEEEDLIVFGDVDHEIDDEIAIESPIEKSRAAGKPLPQPAPQESAEQEEETDEPMFQGGEVIQEVDVTDVPYFTAAGNDARQSYEDNFRIAGGDLGEAGDAPLTPPQPAPGGNLGVSDEEDDFDSPVRYGSEDKESKKEDKDSELRLQGTVKYFNNEKGYGFITQEDGSDLFVHYSEIQSMGYRSLDEGATVEFEVTQGMKGQQASAVVQIDEPTQEKETQFTAYYARQSAANTEYGFYVYAHLPDALISADIQQFAQDLGGRIPKPAIAKQTATLKEGALLTAMVQCDALEFNQIGIMKKWEAPFVRFDFRYTAPEALIDEFVEGRVAIMLGMIEIASIDFQTLITAPQQINLINTLPDDPTQQAHFEPTNPASMYQKIFISYSRKDTFVAEEFRKAQIMMGNTVFMDTHTIRAGEDWEEALKRFIRDADVFQLFWSEHSASSEHCRFEWDYALKHRCSETRCVGFIRPAYWENPLPTPPSELGHLHFAYVPQEELL